MTDLDRFIEFLRREAASYNDPPSAPVEEMWTEIAGAWAALPAPRELETGAYHEPPEPPREEMWERIEAAWTLRRSAPVGARDAGLAPLRASGSAREERAPGRERRSVALWMAGLAVAASLTIGVVLGRGTVILGGDDPQVATTAPTPTAPTPTGPTPTARTTTRPASPATDPEARAGVAAAPEEDAIEALESSGRLAALSPDPETPEPDMGRRPDSAGADPGVPAAAAAGGSDVAVDRSWSERREAVVRYATSEHLSRAATLLTVFRADDSAPEAQSELAGWARDLLGETRLLLDMDVERRPAEVALLEELELVLAQIAQLGPGAAPFERQLIEEGMQRQGTLTRLRSAAPRAGT